MFKLRRKRSNLIKPTFLGRVFDIWNVTGLILLSLFCAYPLWFAIVVSFNDGVDAMRGNLFLWPRMFTLDNYRTVFSSNVIVRAFFVSVARVVVGTPLSVLFTAMVSYPMSKKHLALRKTYMGISMVTMFFSAGLIPNLLLMRSLGLYDTFWVFVIPGMHGFFGMLLYITFFKGLPDSLEEAALIDGCTDFKVFYRIILPLSKPILATMALFAAVGQWNAWFDALIFTRNPNLQPLQTYLYRLLTTAEAQVLLAREMAELGVDIAERAVLTPSLRYATIVVVIVPILFTYPFLQKHFAKGVMIGSIKG